jgi:uncharacterized protein YjiS (DUF1127 family)
MAKEITMNTQAERLASRHTSRIYGFTPLSRFAAWAKLKHEAYRKRRREIEALEALKAMSPELLDDIGVSLDQSGKPMETAATQHPYVIATEVLTLSTRFHDPSGGLPSIRARPSIGCGTRALKAPLRRASRSCPCRLGPFAIVEPTSPLPCRGFGVLNHGRRLHRPTDIVI